MPLSLRRFLTVILPLIGLGVGAISLVVAPPVYRARAVVDLLPLEGAASAPDPGVLRGPAGRAQLQSALLSAGPQPVGAAAGSDVEADPAEQERRLGAFLGRLSWKNVDATPRYWITFDHPDPQRAVHGANLAARALEEILPPRPEPPVIGAQIERLESEIESQRRQGEDLTLLRQRRNAAQQASVTLGELYASARAARLDLESRWKALARGTPSAMLDQLESPQLEALRADRAHLEKRRDELSTRFGPRWPEIVELGEQIEAVEGRMVAVATELGEEALREAEADYRQALAHEREQERLLQRQRKEIQQLEALEERQAAQEHQLEEKRQEHADLLARLERPSNPEASAHVRIVLPASAPPARHGLSAQARLVFGALAGLLLALVTQRVLRRLDPPLGSIAAAEAVLGAPFLASLPEIPGGTPAGLLRLESAPPPGSEAPVTPLAEAARGFRDLRTGLLLAQAGEAARVLLVTACRRGEGKTFVAAHVALSLARRGARVLLIDAHLRRPRVHRLFRLAPGPGLVDTLAGRVRIEETVRATDHAGLFVLPAGDVNGGGHELLDAASLRHLRDRLLQPTRFEHLVIDAGDISSAAAPERLVVACTGVLILVRAHRTLARDLRVSAATVRRHGISFLAGVWIGGQSSGARSERFTPETAAPPAPSSTLQAVPAGTGTLPGEGAQSPVDTQADALDPEAVRRLEQLRGRLGRERGSA